MYSYNSCFLGAPWFLYHDMFLMLLFLCAGFYFVAHVFPTLIVHVFVCDIIIVMLCFVSGLCNVRTHVFSTTLL